MCTLCRQEGVGGGIYVPIEVKVHTAEGKVLTCRSYQMKDCVCGPPSPQYKQVGVVSLETATEVHSAVLVFSKPLQWMEGMRN